MCTWISHSIVVEWILIDSSIDLLLHPQSTLQGVVSSLSLHIHLYLFSNLSNFPLEAETKKGLFIFGRRTDSLLLPPPPSKRVSLISIACFSEQNSLLWISASFTLKCTHNQEWTVLLSSVSLFPPSFPHLSSPFSEMKKNCRLCSAHGVSISAVSHICPNADCICNKVGTIHLSLTTLVDYSCIWEGSIQFQCKLIRKRRAIVAEQTRIRRTQKKVR